MDFGPNVEFCPYRTNLSQVQYSDFSNIQYFQQPPDSDEEGLDEEDEDELQGKGHATGT